jgi:hypothetical protein
MVSSPWAEKPTVEPISQAASSGVATIPTRLEYVPAQIAAGTLPRAVDVRAMDDWTVEGTTQRKSRPV